MHRTAYEAGADAVLEALKAKCPTVWIIPGVQVPTDHPFLRLEVENKRGLVIFLEDTDDPSPFQEGLTR